MKWNGVAAAAALLLAAGAPASADVFKPTRFNDPTPGKCKPQDCSLREAVIAARTRSGLRGAPSGSGSPAPRTGTLGVGIST
jgi:hypothetical protein